MSQFNTVLRIATRRSQLALVQSNWVKSVLEAARPGTRVELLEIVTSGDRIQDRTLREIGGKSLFVKEIEEALLDGRADLAVHSLKDLPTELPPGLALLAVPEREDPRDALILADGSTLDDLPTGACLGTASLRRRALVLRARPDLRVEPLRGNVDTRLRKLAEQPDLAAIVLAEAGLRRLSFDHVERVPLDPDRFVPAACQGALGIESAQGRDDLAWIVDVLGHWPTRLAVEAERAYLERVEGSCKVPVGGHARWVADGLCMSVMVGDEEGDVVQIDVPPRPVETLEAARTMGDEAAERLLLAGGQAIVARYADSTGPDREVAAQAATGTVFLVGAGPGDLGLITARGQRLLETADAVVYDSLANPDLLAAFNPKAEQHHVGKRAGRHTLPQEDISALLVDLAARCATVVRLKGGDPFVFGRGGEEAESLIAAQVPFEVVPGVTSAIAAPAYAGIPLTHRDWASSVAFVTGHETTREGPAVDWANLASVDTVVVLMGVRNATSNLTALLDAGRSPDEPVAAVEWGSFPRQRVIQTTLGQALADFEAQALEAPAVLVIGQVARLHSSLDWYKRRPLHRKRVLVTRSRQQASRLSHLLFQAGATPVEVPALEVCPVDGADRERLDASLRAASDKDWAIFTSPNGVRNAFESAFELGLDARIFAGPKLAVIGTSTAAALKRYGLVADLIPTRFQAEGLLEALLPMVSKGQRVAVFRAREARPDLIDGLRGVGVTVDDVPTYFTRAPDGVAAEIENALDQGLDLITFASSKTVHNLLLAAGDRADELRQIPTAVIGPVTRRTAADEGFNVVVQPDHFVISDLVAQIGAWVALVEGE